MHHPLKLYEDQMSQDRQSTKKPVRDAPRRPAYVPSLGESIGSVGRARTRTCTCCRVVRSEPHTAPSAARQNRATLPR